MHIVIHTQYYPPEIGAPQARLSALARGLSSRGHRVTILTAMPNYPRGAIYDGYGGWINKEEMDGVHVLRTWIRPTRTASLLPRMLSYFSFVLSSLLTGILYLNKPDIIITESPPLFLGISGYLLSRLKRARWMFNVSDLWPESAVRLGVARPGAALNFSYWLEAFFYKHAWCISGQSNEILQNVLSRFPAVKTYHLSNGIETELFVSGPVDRQNSSASVVALYAGLHGLAQGLDQILSAAHQLRDMQMLKFVFVGDGPLKPELIAQAGRLKLENVQFLEPLRREDMPAMLASADFCLVPLGLELPGAVPSKLYEAMSAGRPAILVASGEALEIVRKYQCGLTSPPGDVDALVMNLRSLTQNRDLRDRLGANGRRAAVEHYDRNGIVEKFACFLESA
jgi:glycosyltransferase involved in cell wall biosynthesis